MKHIDIIENGTVIDHIAPGHSRKILSMIGAWTDVVTIGINLASTKSGKKDIIKYPNKNLTEKEISLIAALSPNATINIIADSKVVHKYTPEQPNMIEGIIKCPNPQCITNHEYALTKFYTTPILKCFYCEREPNDIKGK